MPLLATFTVGGTRFGVPAELVQEVVHAPHVTPVPRAPSPFEGLVNLRGRIVAVYSLARRLGLDSSEVTTAVVLDLDEPVALAVDAYCEVVELDGASSSPPPSGGELARCVTGVWLLDGVLVCELDPAAALSAPPAA